MTTHARARSRGIGGLDHTGSNDPESQLPVGVVRTVVVGVVVGVVVVVHVHSVSVCVCVGGGGVRMHERVRRATHT
jgi:hypothetical protein